MKKGLNLWTVIGFSGELRLVEDAIRVGAEIGYDGIEFVFDDSSIDPARLSKTDRKRFLELANSYNIIYPSVATGVFWKYNLGSPDKELRERGIEYIRRGIELAYDLNAKVLLVVPAVANPEISYKKLYENSQKSILSIADYAAEYDVIIGIENVWNKFLYSPLEYRRFIEEINHDYVKAYLDVGNIVNLGYIENWLEIIKDMIAMIHVKDFDVKIGNINGFRHLLQGSINWKKVIGKIRETGYDGFLNVECPPEFYPDLKTPKYPEDGIRAAKDNYNALKQILGE